MGCPTAIVTSQLWTGNLQLADDASLLRQLCRLLSEYVLTCTTTSQAAGCGGIAFTNVQLPSMIPEQLHPWGEIKGGVAIPLEFPGQVSLSSAIKCLVCHTSDKDALTFMQCEVSFVQKLERFKCPRESRTFRYYLLTVFLVRTVLCGDNLVFPWGDQQTACF